MSLEHSAETPQAAVVQRPRAQNRTERRFYLGDPIPVVLNAHDFARIFNRSLNTIYGWDKAGKLRKFELRQPFGPQRWSGRLLQKFLDEGSHSLSLQRSA